MADKRAGRRAVLKRPYYPCVLAPLPAERQESKRKRKDWFPHHREIWTRTLEYVSAMRYLSRPSYRKQGLAIAGGFLLVGVLSWLFWPDPVTKAIRNGLLTSNGNRVQGVGDLPVVGLFLQGAVGIIGLLELVERIRRNKAKLIKERYDEWLAKRDVVQDDLQKVLLPVYKEANPYDPTDPDITMVLGEYYDNECHKFGPVANWYRMRLKGVQAGGVIILGITGSGKTSSMLRPIMRQVIGWMAHVGSDPANKGREKVAGFILDPKGSLAVDVKAVLDTAGIDPILDPLQLTGEGPAKVTALYYLMHKRGSAKRDGQGRLTLEPQHLLGYRGRTDDYLELGYDELKVDRVWSRFQDLQRASGHLIGNRFTASSVDQGSGLPKVLKGGLMTLLAPVEVRRDPQGKDVVVPHDLKAFLDGHGSIPRNGLASMHAAIDPINFIGLDPAVVGPVKPLGRELDDLIRWIWVGRQASSPTKVVGRELEAEPLIVHPMAPGMPFSTRFALDAYAISRNLVRRYAPTKQRPTSGVVEYRDFWGWREVRMWDFRDQQLAIAKRAEAAAMMYTLVRRYPLPGVTRQEQEQGEAFGAQLAKSVRLLRRPLNDLLGPEAVAWEHGRGKVEANGELKEAIGAIRVSLDAALSSAFRDGDWQLLSVPISERPKPVPVDEATKRRLGGRYASPDPLVELALRAAGLRQGESDLTKSLLLGSREGIAGASAEIEAMARFWGEVLDTKIQEAGGRPAGPSSQFLEGALQAIKSGSGGVDDLAADLVATILGMPTVADPGVVALMSGFLLQATGGKGEAFGVQAAHGALNPFAADPLRYLPRAADAVSEEWRRRPLSGTLVAARTFLQASGLKGEEQERVFAEVSQTLVSLVDGWVHAHLAALESTLEADIWREKFAPLGQDGISVFAEADRLARSGGMVGLAEDALVTDARDRIPSQPNVDWGSLIWSVDSGPKGARRAPFWRGPMSGLDMTPFHVSQWDPAWSSITWRLLTYALNAAPSNCDQLEELARRGTVLGVYHQATLESFVATVAPNIGWRTDGVYAYNPLYAPDLSPIVVAGTFNSTVFAATSEGKDSSDPFWENASFTVVFNLLQTLQLVDGYATFPKIDSLVTNEAILRDYVAVLRERSAKRDGTPEEIEIITNILRWVDGEWLTEAAGKSETKDNIIRSLSVVTQPFKEPRFAICFAPAAKEDISFPSWTWVMREGKVVCANLPWEKYEKVAKVVLPLSNKTCQKAVQMRDGQRGVNSKIEAGNRKEIDELRRQAKELHSDIARRAAERLVLMLFFERDAGIPDWNRFKTGDSLLVEWRRKVNEKGRKRGLLFETPCLGDSFLKHARIGSVSLDVIAGFIRAATGGAAPLDGTYLQVPRAVQSGIEAGFLALLAAQGSEELLAPLESIARRNDGAARLIHAFDRLAESSVDEVVARSLEVLGFENPRSVAAAAVTLPAVLLEGLDRLFSREAVTRWTSYMEQLILDDRGGAKDSADQGAGAALRPRFKLRRIFRRIQDLEAQIAEMPNTERPFLYLVDECHFFLQGKDDAQYVSVARSNNAINFYSTQSPNALKAKMDETVASQFLDNLPNRIILRMPDSKAAEACAEYLGGKVRKTITEKQISQNFGDVRANAVKGGGQGRSDGGSVSVSIKEEERWIVELTNIVNLQAFECFAMVWDGKRNIDPRRVYTKPDYTFVVPGIRNYKRIKGDRLGDLPKEYKDGTDLYSLTVPRLLELGVIDASR